MSALPSSATSGLGTALLAGVAMRVPRPAARTIADLILPPMPRLLPSSVLRQPSGPQRGREMTVVPRRELLQPGRAQVAREISPGVGNETHVLALAVALQQPHPKPQQTRVPLGPEVGIGLSECRAIEPRLARGDLGAIVGEQLAFQILRDRYPRILQQRYDVEGEVLVEGVLEVDDAHAGDAGALREPDEVGRVVIAQEPAAGQRQQAV